MAKNITADMKIEAVAGKPVELPRGDFVANADFHRDGADLTLTSPDGHTVRIEGYFSQNPAPDLVTKDGARLSPDMVDAFVPPQHAGQYAASGQIMHDASPAGKITQVVGTAEVIRADGTHVTATVGTPVYPGDVVQTSAKGAVNLLFADNTTFAISESARLSVDQFTYNAHEQSGSTFFSMLQGVFVYTSGLIGKHDPGSVNIETPVGSIGIRGTVVAGHIAAAGHESQITIVDGAVVVTNGAGTMELNSSFSTAQMSSYQQAPANAGTMSVAAFSQSYHAVAAVADTTFSHLDTFAAHNPAVPATGTAPPAQAPADHAAAPDAAHTGQSGNAAPPAPAAHEAAATAAPAPAPMVMDASTTAPPPASSTFGALLTAAPVSAATTSGAAANTFSGSSAATAGSSTFNAPPPAAGSTSAAATTAAPPPPPPPLPPPPVVVTAPPPNLGFNFSSWYDNPNTTLDMPGLPVFMMDAPLVAGVGYVVGQVMHTGLPADTVYTLTETNGTMGANTVHYTSGVGTATDTAIVGNTNAFTFDSATGQLILNDAGVALASINTGGLHFVVTATSPTMNTSMSSTFDVIFKDPNVAVPGASIIIGDSGGASATNPFPTNVTPVNDTVPPLNGHANAADFIIGRGGDDLINGLGGQDTLIGGTGSDTISVGDPGFHFVDGGVGADAGVVTPAKDTLVLGDAGHNAATYDFTQMPADLAHAGTAPIGVVRNIEAIELEKGSGTAGSSIILDVRDIFEMTEEAADGSHTLYINADSNHTGVIGSSVQVVGLGTTLQLAAGDVIGPTGTGTATVHLTGQYTTTVQGFTNTHSVTLIIQQDANSNHVAIS